MFKPEILAPGGGFNSSIHAFEAGADAVYIGMSSFSARKGAKNFSLENLRRLKAYAVKNNKQIFVALNTVIKDEELEDITKLLHHLTLIEVDAIILQDPGLAYIIKKYFPSLIMHASTQMAVHNSQGVDFLKSMGFKRVILSRELTFNEIKQIREDHRDVELEVFIHGAMCYSFSGICLASGTLLGRSGNRGECGQVCRTWFESTTGNQYQFSANDLKAGSIVKDLQNIGIESLKIEGRLKSPEYVSHTVSYYRYLIDDEDREKVKNEESLSSLSFSRNQTQGFFNSPKGLDMVNNQFASHTGILAGKILSTKKQGFILQSETPLSDRDGLLIMGEQENYQFAMKSEGKKNHYKAGEKINIFLSGKLRTGDKVYKVSAHNLQLKEYHSESWKPWKTPLAVNVKINNNSIEISTTLLGDPISISDEINIEKSNNQNDISGILSKNLAKSGTSFYVIENIELDNQSPFDNQEIFLPLSSLKVIKNQFFEKVEILIDQIIDKKIIAILQQIDLNLKKYDFTVNNNIRVPKRKEMNPHNSLIPFVLDTIDQDNETIFFPIQPLLFHQKDFEKLDTIIEDICSKKDKKLILGVNNISHFYFHKKFGHRDDVFFFTDYCTYIANYNGPINMDKNFSLIV